DHERGHGRAERELVDLLDVEAREGRVLDRGAVEVHHPEDGDGGHREEQRPIELIAERAYERHVPSLWPRGRREGEATRAEVLLEHLRGDGGRGLTARAAVLDEHDDGDLGIVGRGESAEPAVGAGEIPTEPRALAGEALAVVARGDDLGRAGLAGDDHAAGDPRVVGRATLAVHDATHRLVDELDEVFADLDLARDLRRGLLEIG